ncbi:Metallophosphoesterase OS=Streptomyces tendae OX=1932 GN=GUR47_19385 PE=4 SV=1 [Streptomyces tendae]
MRARYGVPLGITAVGAAGLIYATGIEPRSFRLRRVTVPVLPSGMRPLRVLQVSDIHMVGGQRAKQRWLRSLAGLRPDFVLNTGDNLSDPEGVSRGPGRPGPPDGVPGRLRLRLQRLLRAPGRRNPARYLLEKVQGRHGLNGNPPVVGAVHNPWEELRDGFDAAGWQDLTNTRGIFEIEGVSVELTGLDDPHIKRDRYPEVAGGPSSAADFSMGVVHAPYLRVLDAYAADGYPLIVAGHTHGGQLCIPFYGALVTNCDLDTDRVKGLSTLRRGPHVLPARLGRLRRQPLHPVPLRLPPEATLLTLVGRERSPCRGRGSSG